MRAFLGTHLARLISRQLPHCHVRCRLQSGQRVVALTFEDGPHPESTPALLYQLARYGVPASFFLIGEQAARHPDLVAAIAAAGHTLGNHSYEHADAWRISTPAAVRDIRACSQVIDSVTGQLPGWWRPPFGHVTPQLATWCHRHGLQTALWDVLCPNGPGRFSRRTAAAQIERQLRPGSIVALRDTPATVEQTLRTLDTLIPRLLAQQWSPQALGGMIPVRPLRVRATT